MKRVLFLCTGNSARSQMAEGLLRTLSRGQVEAFSAGIDPRPIHPRAIESMAEIHIDISNQKSKPLSQFLDQEFDFVISVCARAAQECPKWPRSREQIRWSIDDPSEATGSEEKQMIFFRRIRTELRARIGLFLLANKLVAEAELR